MKYEDAMTQELISLAEKIKKFIDDGDDSESDFNALALQVFAYQYRSIAPYRALCDHYGKTPATVKSWTEIPAVPADAFKHFRLFSGEDADVRRTFRSSGTTKPGSNSQAHFSQTGLGVMDAAVEANARRHLFSDGEKTRIFILAPSPEQAPHMIMAHGMQRIAARFGLGPAVHCVGPEGIKTEELLSGLQACVRDKIPAALLGSSFGFVHLFDHMEEKKQKIVLPEGSRLMDAGGYKGRSREITRDAFIELARTYLGLPSDRIVNLLGMTEMASQIYDDVSVARTKKPPHWMRTQVVDPACVAQGIPKTAADRQGLLRHWDLANLERPMVVQSEDIGLKSGEGFEILKRAKGAEPRGCSLTMEEWKGGSA